MRLLLVDDDPLILTVHKVVVKKSEITIEPESYLNGEVALNAIKENKDEETIFIILLDINMPILNGWEFLDLINEKDFIGEIYVAIVTSSLLLSDREKAETYPQVFEYIKKPLTVGRLNALKNNDKIFQFFKK